jgi:hypothetical protein
LTGEEKKCSVVQCETACSEKRFFFAGLLFTSGSRPSNVTSQSFRPRDTHEREKNERKRIKREEKSKETIELGRLLVVPSRKALFTGILFFSKEKKQPK